MKCVICKHGETQPGTTTVTLERKGAVVIIKSVPAEVCDTCGEAYLDDAVHKTLEKVMESTVQMGVQVVVREYLAA